LVALKWRDDGIDALLTLRSGHLRRHPSEVSWPGGAPDAQDIDSLATARREAAEEIGADDIDVLGRLSSVPLYTSDWRLEPWVGRVDQVQPDGEEVVRLLPFDVAALLSAPFVHAVPYRLEGVDHLSPVWEVEPGLLSGLSLPRVPVVYGGTAHVLWELLEVLGPLFARSLPPMQPGRYQASDVLPPGTIGPS
jgi:8-oxo-dGTP pyrophosphatase MutT (NUDIX family)